MLKMRTVLQYALNDKCIAICSNIQLLQHIQLGELYLKKILRYIEQGNGN